MRRKQILSCALGFALLILLSQPLVTMAADNSEAEIEAGILMGFGDGFLGQLGQQYFGRPTLIST